MGRKSIPEKQWKSLDEVDRAGKHAHKVGEHEGDKWMECEADICKEYVVIFDKANEDLEKKYRLAQKRRKRREEKRAAANG